MDIGRALLDQSSNIDVGALAGRFGISEEQASSAVTSLLPSLLGGVSNLEQGGNLGQVAGLAEGAQAPADNDANGHAIIDQLVGGGNLGGLISQAAAQTGISESVLASMLPTVGNMVGQQVGSQMAGGGLGGIAGAIFGQLGGGAAPAADAGADAGLGGMFGGLVSSLDRDGDGNPLNDILGGFGQRS